MASHVTNKFYTPSAKISFPVRNFVSLKVDDPSTEKTTKK